MILTLIGLRARTPAGTAALSGFTQSTGYLIAGVGPFGIGLLHDLSGGWTVPLIALLVAHGPAAAARAGGVATGVRRGRAGRPAMTAPATPSPEVLSVTGAVDRGQRGKR